MAAAPAAAAPAGAKSGPSRPPVRPVGRTSRHALEPNPFEQSFSSKPETSASPDSDAAASSSSRAANRGGSKPTTTAATDSAEDAQKATADVDGNAAKPKGKKSSASATKSKKDLNTSPSAANKTSKESPQSSTSAGRGPGGANADSSNHKRQSSKEGDASTPGKRLLPPLAAITSPSSEGGPHYPWSGASLGSLRSGPLSPAMLTGPQPFDPQSFRTGFTPDLSNFKTGLTPLGSAGHGYPLPSPGTSAFMAMVNSSGPAMTPGTFQALASHLGGGDNASNAGSHMSSRPNGHSHSNSNSAGDFDFAFGKGLGRPVQNQKRVTPGGAAANKKQSNGPSAGSNDGPDTEQSVSPNVIQQQLASQNSEPPANGEAPKQGNGGQANQAASGLFLLSQAHRELSKRDEAAAHQAQSAAQQMPGVQGPPQQPPYGSHFSALPPHLQQPGQQQQASPIQGPAPSAANKSAKRKKSNANNAKEAGVPQPDASGSAPTSKASSKPAAKKAKSSSALSVETKAEDNDDEGFGSDDDPDDGSGDGVGGEGGDDDEDKRKNFLERNRQAALKCRQRKKAWLQDLQAKVAFFESENGNLQGTIGALRNEVMFLKSQLMQVQQQLAGGPGASMQGHMGGMGAPDGSMMPHGMQMPHPGMHPHGVHPGPGGPHQLQQPGGQQQHPGPHGYGPPQAHPGMPHQNAANFTSPVAPKAQAA